MLSRIAKLGVATVAAATGLAVVALDAPSQAAPDAPAAGPAAAMSPFDVEARGADVPFTEYEAESADHTGTVLGPDHTQATLPAEASGRQAVRLTGAGQYVEFTLTAPANAMDVRYSVQDGREGTLSVYVNGEKLATPLPVTAKYSHIDTPWITGSKTHHFYDNDRMFLGADLAAGDTVRLQVDSGDTAAPYTIDLADFEQVAPAASQPGGSVSVTDHGATPGDGGDDTSAFTQAIAAAKQAGAEVWIPSGEFTLNSAQQIDGVTIRGAGNWHSVLRSNNPFNNGGAQGDIKLYDFAILGAVTERNDGAPDNGFHGVLGANSVVSGLWIENTKCGLWLMNGATSNLRVENNRVQNVMADGINFDGAVTDSVITNNFFRNTGDDAIATWSNGTPNARNSITDNTVVQPNLANGIAVYGGEGATVSGNVVADTNPLGGGIHVGNRFNATPLTGEFTLSDNTTIRAGALDPNWQFGVGALWFDARDSAITNARITVTGFEAYDSPYEAFQFIDGNGAGKQIQNVTIDGATVDGVGTFVAQSQTQGSVTISNVTATGVGVTGTYNCSYPTGTPPMTFEGTGNTGWDGVWEDCATWPDPAHRSPVRPAAAGPANGAAPRRATSAEPAALSANTHLFYYPWYGSPDVNGSYRHWDQGGHTPPDDVGADFYPTLGAYDSGDFTGAVTQHLEWVVRSGAGVIVYSWWGQESYEDKLVSGVLDAAAAAGVKVAWHLEPYAGRTAESTVDDVRYLNDTYGSHPAFYRDAEHGDRGAFYVFESLKITDWSALDAVADTSIVLAQTTDTTKVAHFGGMYTYDAIAGATAPGWKNAADYCRANGLVWAPSVGPGYVDDRAVPGNTTPTLDRANGDTYDLEWRNALDPATGGVPDWVSVTSFNEWHEGSVIEPASGTPPAGHGYLTYDGAYGKTGAEAETAYLDRTKYWTERFAAAG